MKHTHDDDRLTFGCPACIATADEARWTNAPVRRITFDAIVPRHVVTLKGRQIKWRFTSDCRFPDGIKWRGDYCEEIDYGRFDVGADMTETMPKGLDDDAYADALATADLYIVDVQPINTAQVEQVAMFA